MKTFALDAVNRVVFTADDVSVLCGREKKPDKVDGELAEKYFAANPTAKIIVVEFGREVIFAAE